VSSSGSNANTGAEARVSGQAVDLLGQNSEVGVLAAQTVVL
jgi:hypothetical protein